MPILSRSPGFTTTGATILKDFAPYPKTFFFWRSLSQWLGGMGIIVLFVAILPQFAVAGRQMFFAEAPGPTEEKITPRITQTAKALWLIYILLTVLEVVCSACPECLYSIRCAIRFPPWPPAGFPPIPSRSWGIRSASRHLDHHPVHVPCRRQLCPAVPGALSGEMDRA